MFRVWWTHHYGTNEFEVASFIEQKNIDNHKFTTTDTVIPKPDGIDTTEQLGNNLRDIVARHTINYGREFKLAGCSSGSYPNNSQNSS